MIYIKDDLIERWIEEDIPYIDLTTTVLGISKEKGKMHFTAREDMILSGVEEVIRIFEKLGVKVYSYHPTGTSVRAGQRFLEAEGLGENLHMAWKVSLNILEYCSGIATRTRRLVDRAKAVCPHIEVVTTRKVFPGTKELSIKSIIAGGALPHRLGLSETILIFKNHMAFLESKETLGNIVQRIKNQACEKKIIVEVESEGQAICLVEAGMDGLQFDKMPPEELKKLCSQIRKIHSGITLIATGGVNESNVEQYANTGVDVLSTTAVYFGKPADIKVQIEKIH